MILSRSPWPRAPAAGLAAVVGAAAAAVVGAGAAAVAAGAAGAVVGLGAVVATGATGALVAAGGDGAAAGPQAASSNVRTDRNETLRLMSEDPSQGGRKQQPR